MFVHTFPGEVTQYLAYLEEEKSGFWGPFGCKVLFYTTRDRLCPSEWLKVIRLTPAQRWDLKISTHNCTSLFSSEWLTRYQEASVFVNLHLQFRINGRR